MGLLVLPLTPVKCQVRPPKQRTYFSRVSLREQLSELCVLSVTCKINLKRSRRVERLDLMFVKRNNKPGNKTPGNDGSEELHLVLNLLL